MKSLIRGNMFWVDFEIFEGCDENIKIVPNDKFQILTTIFRVNNKQAKFVLPIQNKLIFYEDSLIKCIFHYAIMSCLYYIINPDCNNIIPKNEVEDVLSDTIQDIENYSYKDFSNDFRSLFNSSYQFFYLVREYQQINKKHKITGELYE